MLRASLAASAAVLALLVGSPASHAQRFDADPPPVSSVPGLSITLDGPFRQHVAGGLRVLVSTNDSITVSVRASFYGAGAPPCGYDKFKGYVRFENSAPSPLVTKRAVLRLSPRATACARRHLRPAGARLNVVAADVYGAGVADFKNDITMLP